MLLKWDARAVLDKVRVNGDAGLRRAAEMFASESALEAPDDSGALIASMTVAVDNGTAAISYNMPYAVKWHETPAHFQRGRKSKYLSDPINDRGLQAAMFNAIAAAVRF